MDWTPGGSGGDIEDRRDEGGGGGGGGFGLGPVHLGIGGTLVVGVLSLVFHQNLFSIFNGGGAAVGPVDRPAVNGPANSSMDKAEQPEVDFVGFVVKDVEDTWTSVLPAQTRVNFRRAKLVLYRDLTRSGCGAAQSATGPFYCPEDEKVYLDLGFFRELKTRFGAPGEFAQAYVIAHEFGHHIQKILGTEGKVRRLQQANPEEVNPLSVKLELQADCYAGVWAHTAQQRGFVHPEDVAAGLRAAAAVGDDRLQKMTRGQVSPETFTHGSSAQRTHWFQQGLDTGEIGSCRTFQTR